MNLWPTYERQTEPELTDGYPPAPARPFDDWGFYGDIPGCYHVPVAESVRLTDYEYDGRWEE